MDTMVPFGSDLPQLLVEHADGATPQNGACGWMVATGARRPDRTKP